MDGSSFPERAIFPEFMIASNKKRSGWKARPLLGPQTLILSFLLAQKSIYFSALQYFPDNIEGVFLLPGIEKKIFIQYVLAYFSACSFLA